MLLPVLCLGQEWHVVCQRVRRVYPLMLWGVPGMAFFCFFWLLFCVLCAWEVLVLLVPLLRTRLGLLWCASCWTRLFGVVRRGHYLCNHWRECQAAHKIACFYLWFHDYFMSGKPCMLALAGRPSLHEYGLLDYGGTSEELQAKTK